MRSFQPLALVALIAATPAFAFPWMVRHNYQSCAACHVDPSGGGQLSLYGRAQSDTLLRWKPNKPPPGQESDVPPSVNFLWFAELPEALNLSGNLRAGGYFPIGGTARPLIMATDLYATVKLADRFVAHATTGLGVRNTGLAALAPKCTEEPCGPQWISREYWAGVTFNDEAVMLRAGRMNLPFGLRNDEHSMWVRDLTNTDINLDQQVGASVSYNSEMLRGELMGIAGNFSLGPDAYRERGYSAYAETAIRSNLYVGLSSLITHAEADLVARLPTTRHAHGVMARWSPGETVAVLAELDLLAWQQPGLVDKVGFAGLVQGDFEVVQGLHLVASFEAMHRGDAVPAPALGVWGAVGWYLLPHVELRLDGLVRTAPSALGTAFSTTVLAQLHVFL